MLYPCVLQYRVRGAVFLTSQRLTVLFAFPTRPQPRAQGTGVVKITPAHDPRDYAAGLRHGLAAPSVIDEGGRMEGGVLPEFAGSLRFDARARVLATLEAAGLLRGKDPHSMAIPICSRSGDVVEPRLCPQWSVHCWGEKSQQTYLRCYTRSALRSASSSAVGVCGAIGTSTAPKWQPERLLQLNQPIQS